VSTEVLDTAVGSLAADNLAVGNLAAADKVR
jgi:hypothetical protein